MQAPLCCILLLDVLDKYQKVIFVLSNEKEIHFLHPSGCKLEEQKAMLPTLLLSKVFGIFLVILGAMIVFRRHYFIPVFAAYVRERLTRTVISLVELLIGLFVAVGHNQWTPIPAAVITLLGWMAIVEGMVYLALPDEFVEKLIRTFNTPFWYIIGGLLAIGVGGYLGAYGFGFIGGG